MPATIKSPRTANTRIGVRSPGVANDCPMVWGRADTMPAKIMIETPLPIPFWVISSPIQTSRIVPAVIDEIMASVSSGAARAKIEHAQQQVRAEGVSESNSILGTEGDVGEEPNDYQQPEGEQELRSQIAKHKDPHDRIKNSLAQPPYNPSLQ